MFRGKLALEHNKKVRETRPCVLSTHTLILSFSFTFHSSPSLDIQRAGHRVCWTHPLILSFSFIHSFFPPIHSFEVRDTGLGELQEERPTDFDTGLAQKRYKGFNELTYDALQVRNKHIIYT